MIPWWLYEFTVVVVGVLYPCYQSQLVLENREAASADARQWLTYWTVFGFLLFLDVYFLTGLYEMWWFTDMRFFLTIWLVRSRGAQQLYDMGLSKYIKAAGFNATVFLQGQYEVLRKTVPIDRYIGYADKVFPAFFKRLFGLRDNLPSTVETIDAAVRGYEARQEREVAAAAAAREADEKSAAEADLSAVATAVAGATARATAGATASENAPPLSSASAARTARLSKRKEKAAKPHTTQEAAASLQAAIASAQVDSEDEDGV